MKTIAGEELEREQGRAVLFGRSVKLEQKLEEPAEGQKPLTVRTFSPFRSRA